ENRDVLKLVMKQGLVLAVIGLVIGLIVALGFTRVLASMLYKVDPTDPTTFVLVPFLLLLVTILATYIPARRALKIDPMVALRYD
ncbi:MAG: FtsX-like permease family protein, partial [Planctomycetota bacterium]|nr:FtsX-like permease family protein [Planctomycetota bacterium]